MRHLGIVGIAGVVTGVTVGGLGGRLFMRIAGAAAPTSAQGALTDAGFHVGEVTPGGTFGLVLFLGILMGITGGVLYAVFRPWLWWAGRFRGLMFGVVILAVGSATSTMLDPTNRDFEILGNAALLVTMIVGLFLGYGVMIDWLYGVLDRRLPDGDGDQRLARILYTALTVSGFAAAVFLVFPGMLFSDRDTFCTSCTPPVLASLLVVVTAVGTLVWWTAGISSRSNNVSAAGQILGLVGMGGATLFGLMRTFSDTGQILT